jgi:dihydropteroate synthase
MDLLARDSTLSFPRPPLVAGILNLGEDSFSGDGIPDLTLAVRRGREMVAQGAEIVDVGAESARTNREAIGEQEEIDRLARFIQAWNKELKEGPDKFPRPLLSINTWRPNVIRAVLAEGGDLLNDIGGLPTEENARTCAQSGTALLIMHSVGEPKVPHTHVRYENVMEQMERFFQEKIALATAAGLSREHLLLDPGIDFAKQRPDNLAIYNQLSRLHRFERPILLPVSRKTVIGEVLGIERPQERDAGTVACIVSGILRGANIFRVHNVEAAVQAVKMLAALPPRPA